MEIRKRKPMRLARGWHWPTRLVKEKPTLTPKDLKKPMVKEILKPMRLEIKKQKHWHSGREKPKVKEIYWLRHWETMRRLAINWQSRGSTVRQRLMVIMRQMDLRKLKLKPTVTRMPRLMHLAKVMQTVREIHWH